jgi:phosphate ABC transporter phosphate-binding protein
LFQFQSHIHQPTSKEQKSMIHKTLLSRLGTLCAAAMLSGTAFAVDITGAGATFPYPIYAKWADAYKKATGTGMNYQSIGSGGGIKQIRAKTVQFGASDKPLSAGDLAKDGMMQFPAIMGGVVPVYNLKGVTAGQITLSGAVLADIYLGKIKKWNDPAIAKLSPGAKLPDKAISVVHRSDGSGTTFLFTNYLSKVSPDWKAQIGEGTAVKWPTGVGGKGNEGVANYVGRIAGAIGCTVTSVESESALPRLLTMVRRNVSVCCAVTSGATKLAFAWSALVRVTGIPAVCAQAYEVMATPPPRLPEPSNSTSTPPSTV